MKKVSFSRPNPNDRPSSADPAQVCPIHRRPAPDLETRSHIQITEETWGKGREKTIRSGIKGLNGSFSVGLSPSQPLPNARFQGGAAQLPPFPDAPLESVLKQTLVPCLDPEGSMC